jgi:hypothetical protein
MSNPNPALARGKAVAITEIRAAAPTDTGLVHGPRRAPCPTCKGGCSVRLFGHAGAPRVVCGSCGGSGQAGLITCG